jgi:hypothetical protein
MIMWDHNIYRLNPSIEQWDPPKVNGVQVTQQPSSINFDELLFDDRKVPEIYLYFIRYKKSGNKDNVKSWHEWFRLNLVRLQEELKKHGEGILLEEAKELVKPMAEFS